MVDFITGWRNVEPSEQARAARPAQELPARMAFARNDLRCGPAPGASLHPGRHLKWRREDCGGQSAHNPGWVQIAHASRRPSIMPGDLAYRGYAGGRVHWPSRWRERFIPPARSSGADPRLRGGGLWTRTFGRLIRRPRCQSWFVGGVGLWSARDEWGFEAARGAGRPRQNALRNNRAQPSQNRTRWQISDNLVV